MLTKRQRNSLYEAIVGAGLDASQVELTQEDSEDSFGVGIEHKQGDSSFWVFWIRPKKYENPRYDIHVKVGDDPQEDYQAGQWSDVADMAHEWAREVDYFLNNADLWAELRSQGEVLSGNAYETMGNAPFGADEQLRIAEQLREIKSYLAEQYSLSHEQRTQIEAGLDQLEEATRRIGRKDWLMMFYGVMFTLIVTALVPPDAVQHIIGMVIHGLGDLLGFGGPPPSLPPVA